MLVVGAGILGGAIAWNLARRGAQVTVIEAGAPGDGVTAKAFGWINPSHGSFGEASPLRRLSIGAWQRLERQVPGLGIAWTGAVSWTEDPTETLRLVERRQQENLDLRLVSREELVRLEPGLSNPPPLAAFCPAAGQVTAGEAARRLVAGSGARLLTGASVIAVECRHGRVMGVVTPDGMIRADAVVLAAGVGTIAICRSFGLDLPVDASPAHLLRLSTPRSLVHRVVSSAEFEIRQGDSRTLLAAADWTGEQGGHHITEALLGNLARSLRDGDRVGLMGLETGWRPMPRDGLPIIGAPDGIAGLHVAVMHSAVTLAPIVAELLTAMLLDGAEPDVLRPCAPTRFSQH